MNSLTRILALSGFLLMGTGTALAKSDFEKMESFFTKALEKISQSDFEGAAKQLDKAGEMLRDYQSEQKVKGRVYKMLRNSANEIERLAKDVAEDRPRLTSRIRDVSMKANLALSQALCRQNKDKDKDKYVSCTPRQCVTSAGVYIVINSLEDNARCLQDHGSNPT